MITYRTAARRILLSKTIEELEAYRERLCRFYEYGQLTPLELRDLTDLISRRILTFKG